MQNRKTLDANRFQKYFPRIIFLEVHEKQTVKEENGKNICLVEKNKKNEVKTAKENTKPKK